MSGCALACPLPVRTGDFPFQIAQTYLRLDSDNEDIQEVARRRVVRWVYNWTLIIGDCRYTSIHSRQLFGCRYSTDPFASPENLPF